MIKTYESPAKGLFLIDPVSTFDERGVFTKSFHLKSLEEIGITFTLKEQFYTISKKKRCARNALSTPAQCASENCILHFGQGLRCCCGPAGRRTNIQKVLPFEISSENRKILHIPIGFAHGFLCLSDESCMLYNTTAVYNPDSDTGIHWQSFGFDWPVDNPSVLLSHRDRTLPDLHNLQCISWS